MKFLRLAIAATVLPLGFLATVHAQAPSEMPTRIAVVDVNKVMTASEPGKAAYARLKKLQETRLDEVKKLDAEIAELQKAGQDVTARRTALQELATKADQEISEARERELAALETKIKPVIDAIGAEMKLAAIFNKFESGLVFASDRIDVTDAIIARLK